MGTVIRLLGLKRMILSLSRCAAPGKYLSLSIPCLLNHIMKMRRAPVSMC